MDAITIGIIVAILLIGVTLFQIFKSDHENRQQSILNLSSTTKKTHKSHNLKPSSIKSTSANTKEKSLQDIQTNPACPLVDVYLPLKLNGTQNELNTRQLSSEKIIKKKEDDVANLELSNFSTPSASEPSPDELDSSYTAPKVTNRVKKKPVMIQLVSSDKKAARKKHATCGSLGEILDLIVDSNLSQDEVEIVIKSLFDRNESGGSDWKLPRSDPVQKLKNQLRDSEINLAVAIQNHEQTRARVLELKSLLQTEKLTNNQLREENLKLKKDIATANPSLDQARADLAKQDILFKKYKDESSKVISELEQDKIQFQKVKETEFVNLRSELSDNLVQLQGSELINKSLAEKIKNIESKLNQSELQLDQLQSNRQRDEYKFRSKISELESSRIVLDKALTEHISRFKEVSDANTLLKKSINEYQQINRHQEEMLKRSNGERHVNEISIKRTLSEMKKELKMLECKLSSYSIPQDEKLSQEINLIEEKPDYADLGEDNLLSDIISLREGLATLFPSIKRDKSNVRSDNWVQQYLLAMKQLVKTVEELKESNNDCYNRIETPSKGSVKFSSREVSSPSSNGRSSKAGSYSDYYGDKKVTETKLLEVRD